jgi:hypothetical protein
MTKSNYNNLPPVAEPGEGLSRASPLTKAAAIMGSVLVRLLVTAFYLEIRLLETLNRPHADQRQRRYEFDSSSENPVSNVPLFSE